MAAWDRTAPAHGLREEPQAVGELPYAKARPRRATEPARATRATARPAAHRSVLTEGTSEEPSVIPTRSAERSRSVVRACTSLVLVVSWHGKVLVSARCWTGSAPQVPGT